MPVPVPIITKLLPPIIGGIIGWITNAIAIWMLFHPYKEWHILGYRIPLTPGLIPSRINELADSIAKVIARYLFTQDEWLRLADSLELDDKAVDELFEKIKVVIRLRILKLTPFYFFREKAKEILRNELRKIIKRHLRNILLKTKGEEIESNVEALIRERILKEFAPQRIEKVVYQVCKTELRYIMMFGGMLGVIIGLVIPL